MRAQTLRAGFSIAAALVVGALGRVAFAQPVTAPVLSPNAPAGTEPASTNPITPPKALDSAIQYPRDGKGDARVVLALTVTADGGVATAEVVEGDDPFATAARLAAAGWRFEPALRGNKPVAARIRFEARFVEEKVATPEPAPPEPAAQTSALGPAPAATVTVRGQVAAPGGDSVTRAEARQLPGAFGDPFRAVEALPGVTPVVSAVPYFFIRGAPPGNVGYFIDGVRVPLLFHALAGPSVLPPALVNGVEVYRGGYPAEYGRFAGGIVSATTAAPPDALHGEAGVHLLDASGVVSAPLDDGRAHVTAAGRYAYAGLILSQLTNVVLNYWDYQLLGTYDLGKKDTLGVFAFGAYDYLGDKTERDYAGTQFHRVDVRWDHRFDADTKIRSAVTVGYDKSVGSGGAVSDQSIAGRFDLERRLGDASVLRAGGDVSIDHYLLGISDPTLSFRDGRVLFPDRTDAVGGLYLDVELRPERWFVVRPGVRADVFHSLGATELAVDPRVAAEFQVSRHVKLIHAFGLAHQTPNYLPNLPGAQIAGLKGGLQTSVQSSAGVAVTLPEDLSGSLTFFDQDFFNLSDPLGFSRSISANADLADIRSTGHAYGMELMLRRALTRRFGGILAYTLSRSVRSRQSIDTLSAFDRTHVASLALGYDLGRRIRIGARGVFSSGVPTETVTTNGPTFGGDRAPAYFRLDLRFEKRWKLGRTGYWAFTAEVQNATASREIVGRSCNAVRCTELGVGPLVLPNLGVEAGF